MTIKPHRYFVAYVANRPGLQTNGWMEVRREHPITGYDDVNALQTSIEAKEPDIGKVIITNWQRFEEPIT